MINRNATRTATMLVTVTPPQYVTGSMKSVPAKAVCTVDKAHSGTDSRCIRRHQRHGRTTRTHDVTTTVVSK
jgi:hypothetical protein